MSQDRRLLVVCPSCFSTLHGVKGYAPNLAERPMADPLNWPECRDPWHEDRRDGLKVCFDVADLTSLARSLDSSQEE